MRKVTVSNNRKNCLHPYSHTRTPPQKLSRRTAPSTRPPTRQQIALDLLILGAVTLRPNNPFTWASGLKAPIYCDNRLTMGDVSVRRRLTDGFQALIEEHTLAPDVIAGTATAGIPHAAWLAERTGLPMIYVRSKAKGHGRENLIEGMLTRGALAEGRRVVLVEDTISTGSSSLAATKALQDAGADVAAVLAIYTYGFENAGKAFDEHGLSLYTLTDYDALIEAAADMKRLNTEDVATLRAWRSNPEGWGG